MNVKNNVTIHKVYPFTDEIGSERPAKQAAWKASKEKDRSTTIRHFDGFNGTWTVYVLNEILMKAIADRTLTWHEVKSALRK